MFLLFSKCAREKNNDFLLYISYNLSLVLFCLIILFEPLLYTNNPREIIKNIYSFVFFLATYLKTLNQLIYIDHIILACVIVHGFTIDEKYLWLMLCTKYIVKRRSFEWQNNTRRWIVFRETSTSGETHRVSFVSDKVCYNWEKKLMLSKWIWNSRVKKPIWSSIVNEVIREI